MTLTRKEVLKMISKRIVEAVVLSNHLVAPGEPFADYVNEKIRTWPVLDSANSDIFHQINIILRSAYGIEINKSYFHFTPAEVE